MIKDTDGHPDGRDVEGQGVGKGHGASMMLFPSATLFRS